MTRSKSEPHDPVRVELRPLGRTVTAERGTPLQDLLFPEGVEFPCGGHGRCRGCKIKLLEGSLPVTNDERRLLSPEEIDEGWRLACQGRATENLTIDLAQWECAILADDSVFDFTPGEGLGVAVDLGTTTVVAQLLDLATGQVLAVNSALNAQARHGGDIMSRLDYAVNGGGQPVLEGMVREQVASMVASLIAGSDRKAADLGSVVLVGNTAMHHFFCGIDVAPLAQYPFEPKESGMQHFRADDLGWTLAGNPEIRFLPCIGGFVGSDILAGIFATRIDEGDSLTALIDLGTNGEIVVGDGAHMLCASTAVGPAFEGASISMGMRASTGAISGVSAHEGGFECRVQGNVTPRGICGSGLVDAVAVSLELGRIEPSGRMASGEHIDIAPPVQITQCDVRELQLAKGAVAAGIRILARQWGADTDTISRVYLSGAFGNYINHWSARRIGLLDFEPGKVHPAGNTALLGAKLALFDAARIEERCTGLLDRLEHVPLNLDPAFQDTFVEEMPFPGAK